MTCKTENAHTRASQPKTMREQIILKKGNKNIKGTFHSQSKYKDMHENTLQSLVNLNQLTI